MPEVGASTVIPERFFAPREKEIANIAILRAIDGITSHGNGKHADIVTDAAPVSPFALRHSESTDRVCPAAVGDSGWNNRVVFVHIADASFAVDDAVVDAVLHELLGTGWR